METSPFQQPDNNEACYECCLSSEKSIDGLTMLWCEGDTIPATTCYL